MSDVRGDIDRAFKNADIDYVDVLKGAGALGGGMAVGTMLGRRLVRAMKNRRLPREAMDAVRRNADVYDMIPPDSGSRFRKSLRK